MQAIRPIGGVEVELYSFLTTALEGGGWSTSSPGRSLPPGKDSVPIVQEAGWARGTSRVHEMHKECAQTFSQKVSQRRHPW